MNLDKESFGDSLETGGRRAARTVLKNFSTIVAVAAMVVLMAMIFTDISIETVVSFEWATKLVFYLLCMYVLFFSMQSTGLQDGKAQDVYHKAIKAYNAIRESIRNDHELEDLQAFCDEFIETELRNARTKLLRAASIPYTVFVEKYLEGHEPIPTDISRKKQRAIKKALHLKPIKLTPDMLLNCGSLHVSRSPLGANPNVKLVGRTTVNLLPRTVMMFLVADMAVSVIAEPTWETLVTGIIMCFVGLACAYSGYETGYKNIVDDTVQFAERQVNLLSQYVLWTQRKGDGAHEQQAQSADRPVDAITSGVAEIRS